eukprot:9485711-Pyramimonas_sp.AAC.1
MRRTEDTIYGQGMESGLGCDEEGSSRPLVVTTDMSSDPDCKWCPTGVLAVKSAAIRPGAGANSRVAEPQLSIENPASFQVRTSTSFQEEYWTLVLLHATVGCGFAKLEGLKNFK